ncbi:hypothetical protein [Accumulibacter sp.]|uniref:hypothetical protein n=1 Tax=Accumulibacter sp. TaxID=2053492 RepID=UPI0028C376FE|nr:hypothetical protein [Accumulibacter sp.]
MISHFKPWGAVACWSQALLFAANVAAHPVDYSDGTKHADAGEERGVLGEPAANDAKGVGFADALLREQRDAPAALLVDAQPDADSSGAFAGAGEPSPLARALRAVVNVNARRNAAWSPPQPGQVVDQPAGAQSGEDLSAALLKLEESLAGVVTQALDARVDEQGRVTFSMAGIEGFHITAEESAVSFGHGGASVVVARQSPTPLERRIAALDSSGSQQGLAGRGKSPLQEFFDLVFEVLQYPLTWLVIFLLLLGQVALLIARFRNRHGSHRHRHRSHSKQAQPTVKRTRHRIRIKRVRSAAEPQQP